jgi:hypothetical protein
VAEIAVKYLYILIKNREISITELRRLPLCSLGEKTCKII